MKIAVGSTNPVKIEAVTAAFNAVWPAEEWDVIGYKVDSGVSNQPMSDEESIQGAENRAAGAIKTMAADYAVGLEGGLQEINGLYFDCGWVVVIDKDGLKGIASSPKIIVSPVEMDLIRQGKELGEVDDITFGKSNCKQAEGHYGLMTNNVFTRSEALKTAVICALARFINKNLFDKN